MNPCGTTRRLRALVAIGWDTTTLAQQLGWPERLTTAVINGDTNPPKRSHHPVAHLYDRLSMTPGPNQAARTHAQQHGWAPPLAWDDPDVAIDWPLEAGRAPQVSAKDQAGARLADAPLY